MRKWLRDLGVAFDNLWRALVTPRHVQEDELLAAEICVKLRALGQDPRAYLVAAQHAAAAGLEAWQIEWLVKLLADGTYKVGRPDAGH
ncbi:MAG: hypothetical protein D3X82_13905 [Candidatus Leucobacter sulfamidivorax]|nr:hypothetical protein [Candidatus Leucobacter sulfamidivorax]